MTIPLAILMLILAATYVLVWLCGHAYGVARGHQRGVEAERTRSRRRCAAPIPAGWPANKPLPRYCEDTPPADAVDFTMNC